MRRRRVLWVSSPVSSSFAGGERVVQRLVEGLDAWDHEFLGGSEALHDLFRAGGRASRRAAGGLEPVNPRNVLLFPGSLAWGLAHFLRHRDRFARADVIVCPTSFTEPLTVFPWVVRLLGKRPIALWQNARIPRSIRWTPLAPALRAILGRCRSVFVSESQERTWRRLGLAGPSTVIRNGVRVEELARRGPAGGTSTFGFLGRMHAQKGVDTMLEALARLDAPQPIRVLLGGDGPDLARFRTLGASLARPDVELTWLGWVAEPRRFYE
ncbi:MAG: glycosyltransferase family 4 protein, partial [bacterium]